MPKLLQVLLKPFTKSSCEWHYYEHVLVPGTSVVVLTVAAWMLIVCVVPVVKFYF